jgi:hypothetical protein
VTALLHFAVKSGGFFDFSAGGGVEDDTVFSPSGLACRTPCEAALKSAKVWPQFGLSSQSRP